MKLTVVIPVYRVQTTLDRCVESVLQQHVDNMEIILVDDGSPDNCPKMCDEWAERDPRIKVIHQENGGLSDARNAGIEQATGELITFVDSDDYLHADTYEPLMDMIGNNDIVEYGVAGRLMQDDCTYEDSNEYWLRTQAYTHTYAWNKIYRRELFDEVRFPKGKVFEDVYTLPLLLRKARRIRTTELGGYYYTLNPKGITMTAGGEELKQLLEGHLESRMPMDDSYYMYLLNIQIDVWERTKAAIMLPYRKVNVDRLPGKFRLKGLIQNIFGIKTTCRIFRIKHYIKKPSRW